MPEIVSWTVVRSVAQVMLFQLTIAFEVSEAARQACQRVRQFDEGDMVEVSNWQVEGVGLRQSWKKYCFDLLDEGKLGLRSEKESRGEAMSYVVDMTVKAKAVDEGLLTRILQFKEDLHRVYFTGHDVAVADPDAIDVALKPVRFRIRSRKALKPFFYIMEQSLVEHQVADAIQISTDKAG